LHGFALPFESLLALLRLPRLESLSVEALEGPCFEQVGGEGNYGEEE